LHTDLKQKEKKKTELENKGQGKMGFEIKSRK
jgi:hypothetical protein